MRITDILAMKLNYLYHKGIFTGSEIESLSNTCAQLKLRSIKKVLYRFEQWEKKPKEVKIVLLEKDRLNKLDDLSK